MKRWREACLDANVTLDIVPPYFARNVQRTFTHSDHSLRAFITGGMLAHRDRAPAGSTFTRAPASRAVGAEPPRLQPSRLPSAHPSARELGTARLDPPAGVRPRAHSSSEAHGPHAHPARARPPGPRAQPGPRARSVWKWVATASSSSGRGRAGASVVADASGWRTEGALCCTGGGGGASEGGRAHHADSHGGVAAGGGAPGARPVRLASARSASRPSRRMARSRTAA